jgi:hypothetical protein
MPTVVRSRIAASASAAFAGAVTAPFAFLHLVGQAEEPQQWFATAADQISADFAASGLVRIWFLLWLCLPVAWLGLASWFLVPALSRGAAVKAQAFVACILALTSLYFFGLGTAVIFGLPAFFSIGRCLPRHAPQIN